MINEEESTAKLKKQYKPRAKAKYSLPSLYTSLENLIQILKGYVIGSGNGEKPVSYKEVATIVNLNPARVSDNNRFLQDSGMLVEITRGKFVPSAEVVSFAKSLPWDLDKAKYYLREKLKSTWFYETLEHAFKVQATQDEDGLIRILGGAAQAAGEQQNSLRRIIELLDYAGVIQKDEKGMYTFSQDVITVAAGMPVEHRREEPIHFDEGSPRYERIQTIRPAVSTRLPFVININLNLMTASDDIDSEIQRLRKVLQELKNLFKEEDKE